MIKINLDEGVVFDMLAILLVKTRKNSEPQHINNYLKFLSDIKDEIGLVLLNRVIDSEEFKNLYAANKIVFEAVDLAKSDEIAASTVDRLNYERYLAKKNLQNKFFNSELKEQKIGYS